LICTLPSRAASGGGSRHTVSPDAATTMTSNGGYSVPPGKKIRGRRVAAVYDVDTAATNTESPP